MGLVGEEVGEEFRHHLNGYNQVEVVVGGYYGEQVR